MASARWRPVFARPAAFCCLRPATRIMKYSSRFELTIDRNFSRSDNGNCSHWPSWRTRSLNSSQLTSRLMKQLADSSLSWPWLSYFFEMHVQAVDVLEHVRFLARVRCSRIRSRPADTEITKPLLLSMRHRMSWIACVRPTSRASASLKMAASLLNHAGFTRQIHVVGVRGLGRLWRWYLPTLATMTSSSWASPKISEC